MVKQGQVVEVVAGSELHKSVRSNLPNYVELKKEDHTIRYVLLFMLGFLFLLFLVDLRH